MSAYALLQQFVRQASGLSLDRGKRYLVEDRLRPVLREANIASLEDLARSLQAAPHSDLARTVAETLTINETSFFRDAALFTQLANDILPDLVARRQGARRLRFWCAGCSSGQEPYSLAMLLDEQARHMRGWQIEIVATDFSRAMIETAKRGAYSQFEVQRGLPVTHLLRHFRRDGDLWQIGDHLRARVEFSTRNLVKPFRDLGRFDVVFCRNVLIYYDLETKRDVLKSLGDSLADDGLLVLGAAETVSGLGGLQPYPGHRFLFQKAGASTPSHPSRESPLVRH